jgi:hypothetical protein
MEGEPFSLGSASLWRGVKKTGQATRCGSLFISEETFVEDESIDLSINDNFVN